MNEIDDDTLMKDLAEDFGVEEKPAGRSALEQRILAGFEEIQRFVEQHGRPPQHGEGRDIFERLYAVRLDRLRQSSECRAVLKDADSRGLLGAAPDPAQTPPDEPDDAELQAALSDLVAEDDLTRLVHVRSHEDRKAAEEVAQRTPCADFEQFRPIFEQVQKELNEKIRQTIPFEHEGGFKVGDLFILDGQKVYVAHVGEVMMKDFGREDSRLRVIFDNGTESNMLLRSLQRALYKVEHSRRILPPGEDAMPLFSDQSAEDDQQSGTIYVLRSKSDHPFVAQNRNVIHKIGVTGGDVKTRIVNAKKDPTYLLADVEIVATYKLANISRKALESLLHRFFAHARLNLELKDRFGSQVEPREWFLVPLPVTEEVIQLIDGTIGDFQYDPETARLLVASIQ
ncbi:MAG TPA: GIY-YIG nuclease family protein [Tepidisphaeraceae bacterium]|nr:GIY-YIG nuclease family protein [Tepidisphaeraceae bacterium]